MRAQQKVLALILPLALAISLSFQGREAHASASLSAVGSLNLSNVSISPSLTGGSVGTGTTFGFGFLASTSFIPMFSLELGALYIPRKLSSNDLNGNLTSSTTSTFLEVPLLLRFTALPFVSVGAGPYYAHTLGNQTTSTPGQADVSTAYSSTATQSDFGLEGSVAASLPILPTLSVMGDLRYLLGLTNFDSTGVSSIHTRDFELLVGLTLSI